MITALPQEDICFQLIKQLDNHFLMSEKEIEIIKSLMGEVIEKLTNNFSHNDNKYYHRGEDVYFNPYHSGQYTVFLYLYSKTVYDTGNNILADKIYYLNRMMNGCDLFYEIDLPEYFALDHPLGSVMGRAKYGNGFEFSQNCEVGNNNNIYPIIGENCYMCACSAILGNSHIGNNVTIGAYACVKDQNVPDNSTVFGESPNLIIKVKKQ